MQHLFTRPEPAAKVSSFLAKRHLLLIDNKWVEPASGETFAVEDPGTGQVIAHVGAGGRDDIDRAVAAARRAFDHGAWSRTAPKERARLIWKLSDLIEENREEFAQLDALDNGKPVVNARAADVQSSIDILRYMSGWAMRINGETINVSNPGAWHTYTVREPVGVVGQIVPWNFPLAMAIWKLAPALAMGCTCVLKPAEQTPLSSLRLGELVLEAGFPPGVVNIVTGFGETAGAALASHPDVDKVAFTGSTEVGKLIVKASADNLKRVSLELGGKSPAIVFPDADLDQAIAGTASAIFYNQGQCCTAGSRLFVHKSIHGEVLEGIAKSAGAMKIGHGLNEDVNLGPLVSKAQQTRIMEFIESGVSQGAQLVTGGEAVDSNGYFVQPTVLAGTTRDMRVVREEIFGPVVCVQSFDDDELDAVAAFANDTEFGLQASVWTKNLRTAHLMTRKIRAGTICVNTHNFGDPAWPFGGFKQSGWGRELGSQSVEHYTELKSIAMNLA